MTQNILYKIIASATVVSILALTGCSQAEESSDVKSTVDATQTMESTTENNTEATDSGVSGEGNNILIAYFTAAENSGVDAASSASYSNVNGEAKGRAVVFGTAAFAF